MKKTILRHFRITNLTILVILLSAPGSLKAQPTLTGMTSLKPLPLKEIYVLFPQSKDAEKIKVEVDGPNRFIFQEDILIDTSQILTDNTGKGSRRVDQILNLRRSRNKTSGVYSSSNGGIFNWGRWPEGVIPYRIKSDMPASFRDKILAAIDHINSKTNLCIRARTTDDDDYVEFIPVKNKPYSGMSPMGKIGGKQNLELDVEDSKYNSIAGSKTIIHEILHAAGFIHEHSRSDRDDYVEILWDNVMPERTGDFMKHNFSGNITSYDFKSIMHYKANNASKNGEPTIRPKKSSNVIAPSSELTASDIVGVNTLYPFTTSCSQRNREETIPDILESISYNFSQLLANVSGKALDEGTYLIKCLQGGKYLKVRQDEGPCEAKNGSWVLLHTKGTETCDNRFVISRYGVGYTMKCATRYAEIEMENLLENNVRLTMWESNLLTTFGQKNHMTNQLWLFYKIPGESNKYIIRNVGSGKVLDANNDCTGENDCKVKQWSGKDNDPTQVWILEKQ